MSTILLRILMWAIWTTAVVVFIAFVGLGVTVVSAIVTSFF